MALSLITEELIQQVIKIARQAGSAIMKVYKSEFDVYIKDDNSPVTEADTKANAVITEGLKEINPEIPILSEEGRDVPFEERSKWETFWLVDPLDGTKEFIKKNDEFTINIALLKKNQPVFGVVFAPALDILYWGRTGQGAFKTISGNSQTPVSVNSQLSDPVKIVGSRSHPSIKMNTFTSQFEKYEVKPMGSSLKICSVADGSVHFYPRLGPTMEWDTAAAHAILKSADGEIIKYGTNKPLEYNKRNLLNPEFIAGNMQNIQSLKR